MTVAKFEIFRSRAAAPTSIISLLINLIDEKFDPNLITTPLTPLSLIKVLDPAPRIVILRLFFCSHVENQLIVFYFRV